MPTAEIVSEAYEGYGATRFTMSDGTCIVVQLCYNGWRAWDTVVVEGTGEVKFWQLALIPQGQEHRHEVVKAAVNARKG